MSMYSPIVADVEWQRRTCKLFRVGGVWVIPRTGAMVVRNSEDCFIFSTLGNKGSRETLAYEAALVAIHIQAAGFHALLPRQVEWKVDEQLTRQVKELLSEYSVASLLDAVIRVREMANQEALDARPAVADRPGTVPKDRMLEAFKLERLAKIFNVAKDCERGVDSADTDTL